MAKLYFSFFFLLIATGFSLKAQDKTYAKWLVDTLCTPTMWGRGYTQNGLDVAAHFIAEEMKKNGLQSIEGDSYFQNFHYAVNTFPNKMEVSIDGKKLQPGYDFVVDVNSSSAKFKDVKLSRADSNLYFNKQARIAISIEPKLVWKVGRTQDDFVGIEVLASSVEGLPMRNVSLHVDAKMVDTFWTKNVCGIVKGTQYPDSFILVTAHYDHLGGMGAATYFPGANDNASGVAMLLDLAKTIAAHPLPYSVVFIAFSGEEIGLLGSKYFVENPKVPLYQIRFLMNLDLMGNGSEGITVVNATEFPKEFEKLNNLNNEIKAVSVINKRGKAANSDHYYFSENGVPAFFIYTQGGLPYYHDVYDKSENLPMTVYTELTELVYLFLKGIND